MAVGIPLSIFTRTIGKLNKVAKGAVETLYCPSCGHRMFDAYFIGVVELQCRRCKSFIVVASQGPDVQPTEPDLEATITLESDARVFEPHD